MKFLFRLSLGTFSKTSLKTTEINAEREANKSRLYIVSLLCVLEGMIT